MITHSALLLAIYLLGFASGVVGVASGVTGAPATNWRDMTLAHAFAVLVWPLVTLVMVVLILLDDLKDL